MASILTANTNTAGSGLVTGNSRDSGTIVSVGTPGKPPKRQTYGAQNQATLPIQCDQTLQANFVLNPTGPGQNKGDSATITNTAITSSYVPAVTGLPQVVVTCSAVNDFIAGQSVKFHNLTNASAVNELVGVVQVAGLSTAGFVAIITNFIPVNGGSLPTAASASDNGTAVVNYASREACLSISSERD